MHVSRLRPTGLKRLLPALAATATAAALLTAAPVPADAATGGQGATAPTVTMSAATYHDNVLAGILGEVGGFLSGYEFAATDDAPLPDDWFRPADGPYAGNFTRFTPGGDTSTYVRLLGTGRVRGQDDYFMDFFNQPVLKEKGTSPTSSRDVDADYTETDGYSSGHRLTQHKEGDFEVCTAQTLTGLPSGSYPVRARVTGGGGQVAAYLDVKGYGGGDRRADLPQSGWPHWSAVQLTGVPVT